MLFKVSGLPTPDINWQLNGRLIRSDSSHKMLVRENGVHSLIIEPVTARDAGIYTCVATNRAGQNTFSLELIVAGNTFMQNSHTVIWMLCYPTIMIKVADFSI